MENKLNNVISLENKKVYREYPERELARMWQDICDKNFNNLNKNLLKAISKKEDKVESEDTPLYSKRMFDSETMKYVPFNVWRARHIVNVRKENLLMQIYLPLPYQAENDKPLNAWSKYNCDHLQESLTEKCLPGDLDRCALLPMRPNLPAAHKLSSWLEGEHANHQEARDKVNNDMISHPLYHILQQGG
jgi:hypothetical protein